MSIYNPKPVYKSGNGWVRQFDDGCIIGPFETKIEALQAERSKPVEVVEMAEPVENTDFSKGKKKFRGEEDA